MRLVDSHTHLYFEDYQPSKEAAVERAIEAGVVHMVLPGVDSSVIEPMKTLHKKFPENTSIGIGLHPCDVKPENFEWEIATIDAELESNKSEYSAVGEVGMDLYWDKTLPDLQQQVFDHYLRLADRLNLPVIIHSRDAFDQTMEVIAGLDNVPEMVFHSFSGTTETVEKILRDFPNVYFGINGIVTFKNSRLKDVLQVIPDNQLLLETDSPYLAPVPKRGMVNESAYLIHTADFVAREKGMTADTLADLTTKNAARLFNIRNI